MKENYIPLYCNRCDKHYKVPRKSVEFILSHRKALQKAGNMYINHKGCFFKMLAQLQRKHEALVVN